MLSAAPTNSEAAPTDASPPQGGADQTAPEHDGGEDFLSFRPNYSKKKGSGLSAPVLAGKPGEPGHRRLIYDRELAMSLRAACTVPPADFLVELSPEEQMLVLLGEDAALGAGELSEGPSSPPPSGAGSSDKQPQPLQPQPHSSPGSWRGGGSGGGGGGGSPLGPAQRGPSFAGGRRSGEGSSEQGQQPQQQQPPQQQPVPQAPGEAVTSPGAVHVAPLKPGKGAWVAPSAIGNLGMSSESKVVGSAKGILNKLTKLTFEKLSDELVALLNKHPEQLGEFVGIIFDKVCLEPTFCAMYARLCVKLADEYRDPNNKDAVETRKAVLRVLLEKCQAEFESNAKADKEREALRAQKAAREREKSLAVIEGDLNANRPVAVAAAADPERELELEQRHRYKKLGNVTFLGELFRLGMVPEKTIHGCIIYLVRNITNPLEEDVEHLCKLLTIAGKEVDTQRAKAYMDQYFDRIFKLSRLKVLPSRLRFMLQDVIALRASGWSGVRKAEESDEAAAASSPLQPTEALRSAVSPKAPKGAATADAQPEAVLLSAAEVARVKQEMRLILEEYSVSEDVEEVVLSVADLKFHSVEFRAIFVYMGMIFAMERGPREHRLMCRAYSRLREANLLSASDFIKAWSKVIEELDEIVKDIVFVKQLLADFIAAALATNCVSRAQFAILLEKHRGNPHCEAVAKLVQK